MSHAYIQIFALAAHGEGISGGDRIFIEFARRWSKEVPVTIFLWEEGVQMLQRQKLNVSSIKYQVSSMEPWKRFGFVVNYLARIIEGIRLGFITKVNNSEEVVVYSASEFWMDSLPAFLLKLRFQKIKWAAAWYQTAPIPFRGFAEGARGEKHYLSALVYWLIQFPIKILISRFADFVLVNNEIERKQFPQMDKKKKVFVVLGAIDLKQIDKWRFKLRDLPRVYDGVFQGRFHPQKGVVELIDIWKKVVDKKPNAKLALIGDGPLMDEVVQKIRKLSLEKNIKLFGYVFDGLKKYKIFAASKVVLHPAFFDSGGIASLEAMAFGLPCVGFNLRSFKSYYPKGILKVPLNNLDAFAEKIIELLSDEKLYQKTSKKALQLINHTWSWEYRSGQILQTMLE